MANLSQAANQLHKEGDYAEGLLDPIHDALTKNDHFKNLQANEPGIFQRLVALKTKIAERMESPKKLGHLFD